MSLNFLQPALSYAEISKLLFVVKAVGDMIKDLQVIGEHLHGRLNVQFVKCITELLRQGLQLLHAHNDPSLFCLRFRTTNTG